MHTQAQGVSEGSAGSELTDATKTDEGSWVFVPDQAASAKLETGSGAAAAPNSTVPFAGFDNAIEQNAAERLQAYAANEEEPCNMTARKEPRMVNNTINN